MQSEKCFYDRWIPVTFFDMAKWFYEAQTAYIYAPQALQIYISSETLVCTFYFLGLELDQLIKKNFTLSNTPQ